MKASGATPEHTVACASTPSPAARPRLGLGPACIRRANWSAQPGRRRRPRQGCARGAVRPRRRCCWNRVSIGLFNSFGIIISRGAPRRRRTRESFRSFLPIRWDALARLEPDLWAAGLPSAYTSRVVPAASPAEARDPGHPGRGGDGRQRVVPGGAESFGPRRFARAAVRFPWKGTTLALDNPARGGSPTAGRCFRRAGRDRVGRRRAASIRQRRGTWTRHCFAGGLRISTRSGTSSIPPCIRFLAEGCRVRYQSAYRGRQGQALPWTRKGTCPWNPILSWRAQQPRILCRYHF